MVDFTALYALIVYQWHLPLYQITLFSITLALPSIFISPIAGRLLDQYSVIKLMKFSSFYCVFLTIGLALANNYILLLLLVFLRSSLKTLFYPSFSKLLKANIPQDNLVHANSLTQLISNLLLIIAPAIGAISFASYGQFWCFLSTALCFTVVYILLYSPYALT